MRLTNSSIEMSNFVIKYLMKILNRMHLNNLGNNTSLVKESLAETLHQLLLVLCNMNAIWQPLCIN